MARVTVMSGVFESHVAYFVSSRRNNGACFPQQRGLCRRYGPGPRRGRASAHRRRRLRAAAAGRQLQRQEGLLYRPEFKYVS